jgi:hypothetical protein
VRDALNLPAPGAAVAAVGVSSDDQLVTLDEAREDGSMIVHDEILPWD